MSASAEQTPDGLKSTKETWAIAINYIVGRKRAEQALGYLAAVSDAMAASLEYQENAARVASLTVPYLGDVCAIDLLDDGQVLRQVAFQCSEYAEGMEGPLRGLLYTQRRPLRGGVLKVIETGQPEQVQVDAGAAAGNAGGDERIAEIAEAQGAAVLIVPIHIRGAIQGAISLLSLRTGYGKAYGAPEAAILAQVALRVAAGVEIGRLHARLKQVL